MIETSTIPIRKTTLSFIKRYYLTEITVLSNLYITKKEFFSIYKDTY